MIQLGMANSNTIQWLSMLSMITEELMVDSGVCDKNVQLSDRFSLEKEDVFILINHKLLGAQEERLG